MTAHPADPQGPKPVEIIATMLHRRFGLAFDRSQCDGVAAEIVEALGTERRAPAETPTPALDELFQSANAASSITGRKWMSLEVKHGTFRQALAELRALKGQQP